MMARTTTEYRITYYRRNWPDGRPDTRHVKRQGSLKSAEKFLLLIGGEPWKAFGNEPGDYVCCSGRECGCEGKTRADRHDEIVASGVPPAVEIVVESRTVTRGGWVAREPRQRELTLTPGEGTATV